MPYKTPPPPLPLREREFVHVTDLGRLLGLSRSAVHEMRRDGLLPAPVEIGTCAVWRVREVLDWVAAGAPPLNRWQWRPCVAVRLAEYVAMLAREGEALKEEIRRVRAAIDAGETAALVAKE